MCVCCADFVCVCALLTVCVCVYPSSAERRLGLKAELDRLKAEGPGAERRAPDGAAASKGSISLLELRLPLKADFVCAAANKPGEGTPPSHAYLSSSPLLHCLSDSHLH